MDKYIPWWLFGKRRKDTANQILASASNFEDAEERIRTAIRAGADPNFTIEKLSLNYFGGKEQFTKRQIEIIREDIKKSNKSEHRELLESTELPLFTALKLKNQSLVSFLINAGATINDKILFYAIDKYEEESKDSYETEAIELIINTAKKAGIYESMLKKQNEGTGNQIKEVDAQNTYIQKDTTEKKLFENELMNLVTLTNDMLEPVPNNWTVLHSLRFLSLLAAYQQQPKDDFVLSSLQLTNVLEIDITTMDSGQMVMDWAETLLPGQMGLAIIAHTQAVMVLSHSILANKVLPVFENLAQNVGDVESINNVVIKTFRLFLGLEEQDSD